MKSLLFALTVATILISPAFAAAPLTPGKPIELPGTHGKFDFIKIDAAQRRLLACHTQNGSLDIIDIDNNTLIKSIPTGAAQGVAIDEKGGRYFVSCSKPPKLVIIDSIKLEVTGEVPLPEAADVCTYSTALNRVVVDNDEKPKQWWIDPDAKKIVDEITYGGSGMEDLGFNDDGTELIQNLKDANGVSTFEYRVYTASMKTGERDYLPTFGPTAPAEKPHGLAMLPEANAVLIAGGNGKIVLLDYMTGKVIASADISPRVDEIAYDPGLQRAYAASGLGVISVVAVGDHALKSLGSVPSSQGAHSIAVDPKTHTVWIAYATKDGKAYVQSFAAVSL